MSGHVLLLPFMEQTARYDIIKAEDQRARDESDENSGLAYWDTVNLGNRRRNADDRCPTTACRLDHRHMHQRPSPRRIAPHRPANRLGTSQSAVS